MSGSYDRYDQRRERCMVDQSSSVTTPLREIVRSPAELQRRYSGHPEIADLIRSLNELAGADDPEEQKAGREKLAEGADALRGKYSGQGMSELAQLLGHAAEYLRGDYPLRPVQILPSVNVGG